MMRATGISIPAIVSLTLKAASISSIGSESLRLAIEMTMCDNDVLDGSDSDADFPELPRKFEAAAGIDQQRGAILFGY